MVSLKIVAAALMIAVANGQFTQDPPTTAPSDTVKDCTNWFVPTGSETCQSIAADYLITLEQLYRWNPSLASGCKLITGTSYCVEENYGIPPPEPTTSSTTRAPSATTTGNGITTPTPTQSGMVSNCVAFHFVEEGQDCGFVLAKYGLTLETFYLWNKGVGAQCTTMWAKVNVCVGVQGGSTLPPISPTTKPTTSTTTTAGNGVTTPTPTQSGMVSNCAKFHFVETGQGCDFVLAKYNLPLATFYEWNKGVGPQCTTMWANVNVCVGVIGGSTTQPPTTTSATTTTTTGNGITTPTPTQGGMIPDCDKFDFVKEGDTCATVLARNGISVAQLFAWNSGVGANCNGLWASVYVCVHKIGAVITPTSTTMRTTTTTTGNGIATPTPTMPGMVGNCRKFYKVVANDNCDKIVSKTGASKANIIKWNAQVGSSCNVWLDYYICVGV